MSRNKWNSYTALFIYLVIVAVIVIAVTSILIGTGVVIWPAKAK